MRLRSYLIKSLLLLNCLITSASAETIKHGDLKIDINSQNAGQIELSFRSTDKKKIGNLSEPTIFAVQDPPRIVIDIVGANFKKNATHNLSNSAPLKSIRFGVHKDKVRIVLDIENTELPPFKLSSKDGIAVLTLLTFGIRSLEFEPDEPAATPTESPTPAPSATQTPEPAASQIPTPISTPLPTSIPTSKSSPLPSPTEQPMEVPLYNEPPVASDLASPVPSPQISRKLNSIRFTYLPEDRAPVIVFTLNERPDYSLARVSEKSFRLQIPKTEVASSKLINPFFPPRDFKGLSVVQIDPNSKEDLWIIIGIEKGVKLLSSMRSNEIVIRAVPIRAAR